MAHLAQPAQSRPDHRPDQVLVLVPVVAVAPLAVQEGRVHERVPAGDDDEIFDVWVECEVFPKVALGPLDDVLA